MKLIGVDVGGTFTDWCWPTPAQGRDRDPQGPDHARRSRRRACCRAFASCASARRSISPRIDHVYHGTTIATNAVLENKGARTGMVTTEGYRDIIHIGRHQRPSTTRSCRRLPWQNRPLVRRRHRKVVSDGWCRRKGEVLVPLDEDEVRRAARALRAEGVEAIAVCFLFSYLNPAARGARARDRPRGVSRSASSPPRPRSSPQFREFERFTTAAMNAFIGPKVRALRQPARTQLRRAGIDAELHIMASNGGVATARDGRREAGR